MTIGLDLTIGVEKAVLTVLCKKMEFVES